ncbi:MAG TPA: hypothetical protein VMM38_09205 [Aridibacter sp.]|nr:hypothetical protein [Aridibacter sp.]
MRILVPSVLSLCVLVFCVVPAFSQTSPEEYFDKGVETMKSGRYKDSIPFFDEAINLDSNLVEAYIARSKARSNNQADLPGALEDLNTALLLAPRNGEIFFERALILNSMIGRMIKENGGMRSDELKPYHSAVLRDIDSAITYGFVNERSFSARAGFLLRNFERVKEAIDDYTRAIQYDPFDLDLLMSRAHARRLNEDYEGAEKDLLEVVERFEESKSAGKLAPAKLAEMKSTVVMALNNLSSIYALAERPDRQMWSIEKSIALDPTPMAYISLARQKMIYGNLDESLADYTKAIEMTDGNRGQFYMDRGIVFLLKEMPREAAADFETGRKIEPRLERWNVKYWFELAKRQREQRTVKVELPTGN